MNKISFIFCVLLVGITFSSCDNDDDLGYRKLPYTENYINYDGELHEINYFEITIEPDFLYSPIEGNSEDIKLFYNYIFYLDYGAEIRLIYYDFQGKNFDEGNHSITNIENFRETGKYYCSFLGEVLDNQYVVKGKVNFSSLDGIKIEGKTNNNKSFSLHYKSSNE